MKNITAADINAAATAINNLPAAKRAAVIKYLIANRPPRPEGRWSRVSNLEGCAKLLTHKVGTGGCTQ